MLLNIFVAGFKSIKSHALRLEPVTVLIGANGVGKSNLVAFFRMLRSIGDRQLQLFVAKTGGASTLLYQGAKVTRGVDSALMIADKDNIDYYAFTLTFTENDNLVFESEGAGKALVEFETESVKRLSTRESGHLGSGHRETGLYDAVMIGDGPAMRHVYAFLRQIGVYHFHDTSPEAAVRLHGDIDAGRTLRAHAENLAAFLYRLRTERPAAYERILATVRIAAPFLQDFVLQPNGANNLRIQLRWQAVESDYDFGPQHLSDGTLRFIALTALFLQPEEDLPRLIVLDEPELGLHPLAIDLLAGMVRSVSHRCQVILATQSTTLLDAFEPDQIVVTEMHNGETVLRRLSAKELHEWLAEYSLSELWEKNVLGGRP